MAGRNGQSLMGLMESAKTYDRVLQAAGLGKGSGGLLNGNCPTGSLQNGPDGILPGWEGPVMAAGPGAESPGGGLEYGLGIAGPDGGAGVVSEAGGPVDGQGIGTYTAGEKDAHADEPKEVYDSIKQSPHYPKGFKPRKNGTTKNSIKNGKLLDKLRQIESGIWRKIYKDGYDAHGNKISVHYFQSKSGKVFDVKVKSGWSN